MSVHFDSDSDGAGDIAPNFNHEPHSDLPILSITSYGHRRGPLVPAPSISLDLRTLPNPPKHVRDSQTGLSKPLQDWLFSNSDVQTRFKEACTQIRVRLEHAGVNGEKEVTVGVCCHLGKHRSVAFVEALGKQQWDGWEVVVDHRDVTLDRSSSRKQDRRTDRSSKILNRSEDN